MKRFVGYIADKIVKSIPRKKKVSPDIKSVKKFTEKSADQFGGTKSKTPLDRANVVRKRESIKRMDRLESLQKKRKEGIKASKEVKKMVDTGQAKRIFGTTFHKGVREKKMGGGMMGRRMGYKKGSKFPDLTGDGKVTFADILKGRGVINGKKPKTKGAGSITGRGPKKPGKPM